MSSGTSTKRRQAPGRGAAAAVLDDEAMVANDAASGIRPSHLFVVAGLFAASLVVIAARGQHVVALVLLSLTVFAAAIAALAVYRTLDPLMTGRAPDAPDMLGGRTRAALEREKTLVLRSIKELEFDRAMGKVSAADFDEMEARLRARAIRLMQQLDKGSGYRDLIERELARRVGATAARPAAAPALPTAPACGSCGTPNDADARFCKSCGGRLEAQVGAGDVRAETDGRAKALPLLVIVALLFATSAQAQAGGGPAGSGMPGTGGGMPGAGDVGAGHTLDLRQMTGIPIPVGDLPVGTVSVRVVRQQLGNNIANQEVELQVGNEMRSAKTDASGRAQFTGLAPGTRVRAFAQVDGEKLMSEMFEVAATGGTRVLLASGLAAAAEAAQSAAQTDPKAPPVKGTVAFGPNSQIVTEFQDDGLSVFYLLEIVNTGRVPVDIGGPLLLDMPHGAVGTAVMEQSTKQASARGTRVTVMGPFPPGTTPLQIAFRLPYFSSNLQVTQRWPVALQSTTVVIQKVGNLHVTSPQFAQHGDRQLDNGTYIVGTGGTIPAGGTLALDITGLPCHATWPRYLALTLAGLILAGGAWLARGHGDGAAIRARLQERRDRLFAELVRIEEQHQAARIDDRAYEQKRQTLMQQLERVYGELDSAGGPVTRGGGEGLAA